MGFNSAFKGLKATSFSRTLIPHTGKVTPDLPERGFQCLVSDISEGASSSADSDVILYVTIRKLLFYVFSTYFSIRAPRCQEMQRYGVNTHLSRRQRECTSMDKTPLY